MNKTAADKDMTLGSRDSLGPSCKTYHCFCVFGILKLFNKKPGSRCKGLTGRYLLWCTLNSFLYYFINNHNYQLAMVKLNHTSD